MPYKPRRDKMDPSQIETHHVWSRCVARAYLFGYDPLTGQDFSYRLQWLESLTEYLAGVFAVEVGTYHWMSNHIHGVLRNRPDIAKTWGKEEICWRWKMAWPRYEDGQWLREPTDKEIEKLLIRCDNEPERLDSMRRALGDISSFMARLKEPIAKMANAETGRRGHHWEQRYGNHHLKEEQDVVASFVYNDLQKVAAGMVNSVEESEYSGITRQLKALAEGAFEDVFGRPPENEEDYREVETLNKMFSNCFLSPITDRGPLMNQRDIVAPPSELILPAGYHTNVPDTTTPRTSENKNAVDSAPTTAPATSTEPDPKQDEDSPQLREKPATTVQQPPEKATFGSKQTQVEDAGDSVRSTATSPSALKDETATTDNATEPRPNQDGGSPRSAEQPVTAVQQAPVEPTTGSKQTPCEDVGDSVASTATSTGALKGEAAASGKEETESRKIHERYRRRQRRRASRNSMLCMPWEAYFAILKLAEAKLLQKREQGFTRAPPKDLPPGVALPSETTATWRAQLRDFTTSLQAWAAQMPRDLAGWVVGQPRGDPEPADGL